MTDVVRNLAAQLLELPEEAAKLMGQGLEAIGNAMEAMAARIDALEEELRGK